MASWYNVPLEDFMKQFKPCSYCGQEKPKIWRLGFYAKKEWVVYCSSYICRAETMGDTADECLELWNRGKSGVYLARWSEEDKQFFRKLWEEKQRC